jgi:hypothetical protein
MASWQTLAGTWLQHVSILSLHGALVSSTGSKVRRASNYSFHGLTDLDDVVALATYSWPEGNWQDWGVQGHRDELKFAICPEWHV